MSRMVRGERYPPWVSLILTAAVMCFLPGLFAMFAVTVLDIAEMVINWKDDVLSSSQAAQTAMSLITIGVVIVFAVTCVWVAREMYRNFRWKKIPYDGSWCLKCGYSLTGNVSGICPECGEKISLE